MNPTTMNKFFRAALSVALMFIATAVSAQQLFVRPVTGGTAVRVGELRQFEAILAGTDGSLQAVTPTWSISPGGPASVDASGNVTGNSTPINALAVLTATYSGLTAIQNLTIQASQDIWNGGGGPGQGGDVRSVVNTNLGSILAPVFGGGIYRTTVGAGGWEPSYYGIPFSGSAEVRGVRAFNGFVFAAVEGSGIYRSTNGGASWSSSNSGMGCNFPRQITSTAFTAGGAAPNGALYVAANCGVYKSTNNGGSWFSVSSGLPTNAAVTAIQALSSSNTVWSVVSGQGIYRSNDGGANWASVITGIPTANGALQVYNFTVVNANLALAMVEGAGIYRLTSGGTAWEAQNSGLPVGAYGFQGGITTPGDDFLYVAIDGQGIYRGTTGATNANSVTWTAWATGVNGLPKLRTRPPTTIVGGNYYVPTGVGVYIGSSAGTSWSSYKSGLPGGYIINTVTEPGDASTVYAAGNGVYKSTDGGSSWAFSSTGITGAISGAQRGSSGNLARATNGHLYVSTVNAGIFKSINGAATWTAVNNGLPYLPGQGIAVRPDPTDALTMYALFSSDALGVYKTADGGLNWTSISGNLTGAALRTREIDRDPATGALYLATNGGVYKSADGGGTWSPIYTATGANHVRIDSITTPPTVYWSTSVNDGFNQPQASSGVYKSVDEGASYAQLLSERLVQNLRVIRSGGWVRLYVASQNLSSQLNRSRVLKSTDGGTTWESIAAGMRHQFVNSFDPNNTSVLRASTTGGGVYALDNSAEMTALAAAQTAVSTGMATMMGVINAQGTSLNNTHLAPFYDAAYLHNGHDAALEAKVFASDVRGANLSSFNITGINSFDAVNGIINVKATIVVTPGGVETLDGNEDGQFIFKRQGDGSYKAYGNQRIADASVQVEMRTDYGPNYNAGPRQHVNLHIEALPGVLSATASQHSMTAVPNPWAGLGVGFQLPLTTTAGGTGFENIEPSPGVPEQITKHRFFGGFEPGATSVTNGTIFQVTLTKADTNTVTYNVPFTGTALTNTVTDAITNVTVNGGTTTAFPIGTLSSPLNLAWTQPIGYTVQSQRLYGYVQNSNSEQCSVNDENVPSNATSGSLTLPTICGTAPITFGGINVTTEGADGSGLRSNFIYQFNIAGAGPAVGFSTGTLGFGSVNVGQTSSTQNITVTNTGTSELSITTAAVTGSGFAASANACTGANLAAGQSCVVSITFTPSGAGAASGSLSISSNAPGGPHSTALSGTGVVATAPGAPTSATASPGNTQATVSFAAPASNGGAAITSYTVTSSPGGITATGGSSPIIVTGLTNGQAYTFTVTATNSAGTGAASSASSPVTPSTNPSFAPPLVTGFNLLGNSLNTTLNVMTIFGDQTSPVSGVTDNIASVWKWDAVNGNWQFHSPLLSTSANATYAANHGYGVLTSINVGEGYWVNALSALSLPAQTGPAFSWNSFNFAALPSGFNLIAHASQVTPSQFNVNISATPPSPGVVPTDNFASLWVWDAANVTWFFYSPLLESSGGLAAVKSYADSHFYQHFQDFNKKIDIGVGFWVNKF